MLDRFFKLKENNTNIKTEILAGITTFMTMAYILAVNPQMLGSEMGANMNGQAVLIATALASFVGCLAMALLSNYPLALAPGMGMNAYFSFTVCGSMGYSYKVALFAVFVEGIIFIILSLTNVREAIINLMPMSLKNAVSVGIGLFIAFVGAKGANLIVDSESSLVTYQNFNDGEYHTYGITAALALLGIIITSVMLVKKVNGGIFYGIIITWGLGIVCELTGLYIPNSEIGMYSLIPDFSNGIGFSQYGKLFGEVFKGDFGEVDILDFIVVMFAFLFVDLFNTLGTLVGVAAKADMLDKDGKLPKAKEALLADAIATSTGAVFGTSTTTTYVESAAGVTMGGRTGLTALTTGVLFLLSIVLSPIFVAIPSFATAPALIVVGFYMIGCVTDINFNDMVEAIPAFLTIIVMPFAYSIAEGIAAGIISYTVIVLFSGKAKEKKLSPLMYVLTILFILKYIFL